MTPEQKELLRHAILLQIEAASPASLPADTILQGVKLAGHRIGREILSKELQYLGGKGLLKEKPKTITKSARRYQMSADGIDYLEEQGLV